MKKLLVGIVLLFSLQVNAQFKQVTLQASGLTCAMCSNAINKALSKLSFIENIRSNIKESSFSIALKEDQQVDFDAIRKAVEGAGFSVANMKVKANFDNVSVKNDAHVAMAGKNLHFLNVKQQVLNGEQTLQVVDKKFVSDKEYKKHAASTKMECVKTGVMANCCTAKSVSGNNRVYHVTI